MSAPTGPLPDPGAADSYRGPTGRVSGHVDEPSAESEPRRAEWAGRMCSRVTLLQSGRIGRARSTDRTFEGAVFG